VRRLRRCLSRLRAWTRTASDEARLRQEIDAHVALLTEEHIKAGLPPVEARRQALLTFGAIDAITESYRDQRTFTFVETLIQDVRYAVRRLARAPAFTMATVLTLALGIGATTSIFTLVHAVLLTSLPVANPDELYRVGRESRCCYLSGYSQDKEFSLVSYALYEYLRDNSHGFAELAAFPSVQLLFGVRRTSDPGGARTSPGEFVSGNYFSMFGIRPYAGRLLTPDDDRDGAPPVAVISYGTWQQRYGTDPSVIGGTLVFNGKPVTVVGVAPPGFFGDTLRASPPDFFLPLHAEPLVQSASDLGKYDTHWLQLIGRIGPDATPSAAEASLRVALKQWLRSHWGEMSAEDRAKFPEQTLFLTPGGAGITSLREQYGEWLLILWTVTGFVLLIVCANVAGLMLVRGLEQRRQVSMAVALGARLARVVRQPLIESLLLSLAGGAAGVAIAFAGTRLLLRLVFPVLPGFSDVPIDAAPSMVVLVFAFAISLVTGIAFGIAPAWMAGRVDPVEALHGSSRATTRAGSLPRKALVVAQVALSLMLLSVAGLLTAALQHLEHQRLGFEPDGRLVVKMDPSLAGYTSDKLPALYRRIRDSVETVPGVSRVALGLFSPPGGGWSRSVWIDGRPASGPMDILNSSWNRVSAGYFDVVGTRIVKGRGISERDTATSPKVAVVSEAFARQFFRGDDPIGRHFGRAPDASREFEIVGVTEDARYYTRSIGGPAAPIYFLPETQADYSQTNLGSLFLHDVVIATKPGARVTEAAVREAMASADPGLPLTFVSTLRDQVSSQFTQQRLIARLTSLFALLSVVLVSVGLYGVTASNAGSRTNEIGVRMVLGATRGQVVLLVLRSACGLAAVGLAIGLPLAVVGGRLLSSQLYGTPTFNAFVTLGGVLALGCSAVIASLGPAIRASRMAPWVALRAE